MGIIAAIRYFPEFVSILRNGEFTGDAVILKSTFGKFEPSVGLKAYIDSISGEAPDFSTIDFSSFADGTFGASYFKFIKQQGLKPFRFSGKYKHLMTKNYLPIYYASIHDFYHVLTGYDASFAGESGVWAFVAAQNISPQAQRALNLARLFFPIAKPSQRRLILEAADEGFKMGKQAKQVLTMDFRSELANSLNDVRRRHGIVQTSIGALKNGIGIF